ncbi:HD domain-containing protein [Hymenobacter jeollabukensis]|uniref:Bifunctional (P)ppGpp synthetase/guanosine-3',5'-bis(Diphosphate) 3'-pyrophosphohydrolase n=1 Tax=Hymenobacter jeollabukensis TaxID=2025313 RepID=A0A5R8WJ60_9BACT|nr:HD domain-containing protein [Hymenobacter jeollabukensis]TLM88928.1 bifunctional (p)ppGpp synthetase/guanosine-3',5'-bis(diphosphate) 3'-pyrophosphohydrolase [Hymenobacter jeollabukensis]
MQQATWSIDEVQQAWQLATRLHDGQKYGGPDPGEQIEYLNHIGSVTLEVLNAVQHTAGLRADLAIKCAILHDVVEDTAGSYEQIRELFGPAVAAGVLALTKSDHLEDKAAQMRDSLRRIREQPVEIWAVKLADRIVNLSEPPYYWDHAKKRAYLREAELILTELQAGNEYLANRLRLKIRRYHSFLG